MIIVRLRAKDHVVVVLEGPELVDGEESLLLGFVDAVDDVIAELVQADRLPDVAVGSEVAEAAIVLQ